MKWYIYAGAAVVLLATGFIAGRRSVHQSTGTITNVSNPPTSRDGGVPEAVAQASTGGSTSTTSITCKAEPPPRPRIIYLSIPNDAGVVACPEPIACPTLTCSSNATSTTGSSQAESSAPVVPPQVITVTREIRSTWGIGAVGEWSKGSGMHPGGGIVYQPWKEVEFSLAGTTLPSVTAGVYLRF